MKTTSSIICLSLLLACISQVRPSPPSFNLYSYSLTIDLGCEFIRWNQTQRHQDQTLQTVRPRIEERLQSQDQWLQLRGVPQGTQSSPQESHVEEWKAIIDQPSRGGKWQRHCHHGTLGHRHKKGSGFRHWYGCWSPVQAWVRWTMRVDRDWYCQLTELLCCWSWESQGKPPMVQPCCVWANPLLFKHGCILRVILIISSNVFYFLGTATSNTTWTWLFPTPLWTMPLSLSSLRDRRSPPSLPSSRSSPRSPNQRLPGTTIRWASTSQHCGSTSSMDPSITERSR